MRGCEAASANLFSFVRLEERVPADRPLRPIHFRRKSGNRP